MQKLDIAKGSFYRYFESKESLYFFLLEYCMGVRLKNDEAFVDTAGTDLFELINQHFKAKIHFDMAYPLHSAFLYNVVQERNSAELGNIQLISKQKAVDVIKQILKPAIKAKVLRKDIDMDVIALMIFQVQLSIFDYMALVYQIDFRERIRNGQRLYDLPEPVLYGICAQFTEVLRNGLLSQKPK